MENDFCFPDDSKMSRLCGEWQDSYFSKLPNPKYVLKPLDYEFHHELEIVINPFLVSSFLLLGMGIFGEADRLRQAELKLESNQLKKGFSKVEDAQSSNPKDQESIWAEIKGGDFDEADKTDQVNGAVRVLLHAGMSEPSLRRASERGVVIEDAGMFPVMQLYVVYFVLAWSMDVSREPGTWFQAGIFIVWSSVFALLGPADRAFALQAMFKSHIMGTAIVIALHGAIMLCLQVDLDTLLKRVLEDSAWLALATGAFGILCSAAGVGRVAEFPCGGVRFASLVISASNSHSTDLYMSASAQVRPQPLGHSAMPDDRDQEA
eukprot:gnl/TRDRNA2_/TRDRNA2_139612_c2_seq1.p1 gnl/TRDRNA2_/TRDRNA2_139612_c2~~gnl/TRDRNA2_/TRDRNA2_139612_c2_seq1.p1  ORF type:complete len:320 (+),score=41.68 gnl/TRDRNA2_/TRDRNA2_139612_c2_seq1:1-960(+)